MSTTQETPVAPVAATNETVAPTSAVPETSAPLATADPAIDSTAPAATTEATPAVADEPVKDTKADDLVKVEASPITSGNLGYKTGPLKLFKFSQRYFWLGDEAPLEESTIAHFHKGNHENKHHTAAHASQTGKGLLLFAKREEDKTQPEGIFNLSEVSDVVKEGALEFSFKVNDKKQSFQATKSAERDGWLVAINNAVTEATGAKDTLRGTEAYKTNYSKYFGSAGVAAAGAAGAGAVAASGSKTDDKVHDGTAASSTTAAAAKPETSAVKKDSSRSRSRGFLGKLKGDKAKVEDTIEKKKEERAIKKEEQKEEKAIAKEEKAEEKKADDTTAAAPAAAAAAAAGVAATPAAVSSDKPTTETAATAESPKTPTQKKRGSVFGSIFGANKKSEDVKAKETEPVAAEAPKVDSAVESGAPLTESVPAETAAIGTTPAAETTATTTETPAAAVAATPATATEPKKTKEKSPSRGIKGFFSKKESQVEKKVEEKKIEKEEKKAVKEEEKAATEATPATTGVTGSTPFAESAVPAATTTEPSPVADTAAPATTATTTETPAVKDVTPVGSTKKEERRRSIFDSFKSKPKVASEKDTTVEAPAAAAGVEEPKDKKMFNLFRSSSKKAANEPASTSDAPPVPAKDTEVPATTGAATETPLATETKTDAPLVSETKPEVSAATTDAPVDTAVPATTSQPTASA